jgi:hypothetical protein
MADRGCFYIIYRPRDTPPARVENPAQESRSSYYWPSRHVILREDEEGNEIEVETVIDRGEELQFAIDCHSHPHYADPRRDTWIVDQDGYPVAVIRFIVEVSYHPRRDQQ